MRGGVGFEKGNAAANDTQSATTWHAVGDSLASDFPLCETGKSDKSIDQFLNWSMKATCVAFVHDSNPSSAEK